HSAFVRIWLADPAATYTRPSIDATATSWITDGSGGMIDQLPDAASSRGTSAATPIAIVNALRQRAMEKLSTKTENKSPARDSPARMEQVKYPMKTAGLPIAGAIIANHDANQT